MSIEDRIKLYAEAMRLRKEKGWGDKRIAKALNMSVNTVAGWLYKGYSPITTGNPHMPNLEPSPELSYVIGVVHGDGWISAVRSERHIKKRIGLATKDRDFVKRFNINLCKVLKKKNLYSIYFRKSRGYYTLVATSKFLFDFLKKGWENLKHVIERYPGDFIRGFADSEGSVILASRCINLYNTNLSLLKYVQELLNEKFKITSHIFLVHGERFERDICGRTVIYTKPVYMLKIFSRDGVIKFWRLIGFSIARKQRKLDEIVRDFS